MNHANIFKIYALAFLFIFSFFPIAHALEAVDVPIDKAAVDLSDYLELYKRSGSKITVTTAPDENGVISRIEVLADSENTTGNWFAFALANKSDQQIDRLIVAPHFRLSGSGLIWPDLGARRIKSITPSQGFALDRQTDSEADVFRITLDPGTVVTLVAEMSSNDIRQLTLWQPDEYKDAVNSFTLYEGIVLGIAGLLALFLTIIFVVKGSAMFPATASLAWATLLYICVDFGFISKIVSLTPIELNVWRSGAEVFLAGSLIVFLYAYLHLYRWNTRYNVLVGLWLAALIALFIVSAFAPEQVAGIARISFALTAFLGLILIILLAIKGFDRAILLIPTWGLIQLWLVGSWLTVTGQLSNDIIQPALGGGLVLIILLLSFTVMQHAFVGGTMVSSFVSDTERQALAQTGSGDAVWDWDVDRDEIFVGPELTSQLGLAPNSLNGSPNKWLPLTHPEDRDRFKSMLDVILEHRRGRLSQTFKIKASSGQYHWLSIRARPIIGNDGEVLRCVGTVTDISDYKIAHERMLHDAVHDNLTGLPNRELFLDRLEVTLSLAKSDANYRPTLFIVNFDRFSQINESVGFSMGDTILLTMARRMTRLLEQQDCLARLNGDQFVILVLSQNTPEKLAFFAQNLRKVLKAPVNFSEHEIIITSSIGLVSYSAEQISPEDMIRDAETAMYQAKRMGGDRIEPFRPAFRSKQTPHGHIESDLRLALSRNEIEMHYQPIINLESKTVAGFEALMRWHHPRRGLIMPSEFIPIAEKSSLIIPLGLFAMEKAAEQLSLWQKQLNNKEIFISVNISSRQLMRHDLINDVKKVLTHHKLATGTLKLELTETLIMENPEQSSHVLTHIKNLGAGLSLDDFGTGYSSLSHLMHFPFDTVKIDRSLIRNSSNSQQQIILRSIVTLVHELGMQVVAEGAEDENDAFKLHQLGCEYAQGFLYGRPMTPETALLALKQDQKG